MSRSAAFRLMGGALLAGTTAGLRPRTARSSGPAFCGGSEEDSYTPGRDTCCPPSPPAGPGAGDVCIGIPNGVCCSETTGPYPGGAWCHPADWSCCGTGGGGCPRGYTCCVDPADTRVTVCCPPDVLCCGGGCCPKGDTCVQGKCQAKSRCRENETLCGARCCNDSTQYCADKPTSTCCRRQEQVCVRVDPASKRRVASCCKAGAVCCTKRGRPSSGTCCANERCCRGQCCRTDERCAGGRCCKTCGDRGACCGRGDVCCGDRCCKKGETCGIWTSRKGSKKDRSYICCKTKSCRSDANSEPYCCPGKNDVCVLRPGGRRDSERICCPPKRVIRSKGTAVGCCPAGMVSLNGNFVVGGGARGDCCPEDQACGSGDDITCCPKRGEEQRACCSGVCADLQYDQKNCGTCGSRCRHFEVCKKGKCVGE
jgi:hypothetical protein